MLGNLGNQEFDSLFELYKVGLGFM